MKQFEFIQSLRGKSDYAKECVKRNIPIFRLGEKDVFQVGLGIKQNRIYEAALSYQVGHSVLCEEKNIASNYLRAIGFSVPRQVIVDGYSDFRKKSKQLKAPLVIKPNDGLQTKGVNFWHKGAAQAEKFIREAKRYSNRIVVEEYCEGLHYRIITVRDKVLSVITPIEKSAFIVGDGKTMAGKLIRKNIKELPFEYNFKSSTIRRFLLFYNYNLQTIVPKDKKVMFYSRNNNNLDVTDKVHADNMLLFGDLSMALGGGVRGLDFITPDITKSYKKVGGWFNEVNSNPALRLNTNALNRRDKRSMTAMILEAVYPKITDAWIPIYQKQKTVKTLDQLSKLLFKEPRKVTLSSGKILAGDDIRFNLIYYLMRRDVLRVNM